MTNARNFEAYHVEEEQKNRSPFRNPQGIGYQARNPYQHQTADKGYQRQSRFEQMHQDFDNLGFNRTPKPVAAF